MKKYLICVTTHFGLLFAAFSAMWFVDDALARIIGGVADVLMQPFMGPARWIALPDSVFVAGSGLPLVPATSLLWGAVLLAGWRLIRAIHLTRFHDRAV